MRKEISLTTGENKIKWVAVFVTYNEGVKLPLEDIENIFDEAVMESIERELADSDPLYADDEGDQVPAITIPTLIEAVVNTADADRVALYSLLAELEKMLVKIWG